MPMPIKDHADVLGVRGKTVSKLRAINIETLEDLAEISWERLMHKLECTSDRAKVLINRARRAVTLRDAEQSAKREQHSCD